RGSARIQDSTVPVEPLGRIRLPNLNLLDVRVEKRLHRTNRQNLTVRVNVFNATNINTVTARVVRSGATYLFPTAIVLPRIFDFSASYSFCGQEGFGAYSRRRSPSSCRNCESKKV